MADMEPVQYLTTPAFSSNDPATDGLKMIAVDDNPQAQGFVAPADRKATDWVDAIEATTDQESLDAVLSDYEGTGKDFKSVADAADKKQDELDAA